MSQKARGVSRGQEGPRATGDVPKQPEGHGAQEGDKQHGEVPDVRVVLRRLLPVPGSVVTFCGVTHAMAHAVASGEGGVGWRIWRQVQGAEEAVAQQQRPRQEQGEEPPVGRAEEQPGSP